MKRDKQSTFTVAIVATALVLGAFVAVALASEDPPGNLGNISGGWFETPYSQLTQNECDTTAGEICMEWCWTEGNVKFGTGELCCVANGECRTPR